MIRRSNANPMSHSIHLPIRIEVFIDLDFLAQPNRDVVFAFEKHLQDAIDAAKDAGFRHTHYYRHEDRQAVHVFRAYLAR